MTARFSKRTRFVRWACGMSTSRPRRRRDSSPQNIHVVAAVAPRPVSAEYPRRSRGGAAARLRGIFTSLETNRASYTTTSSFQCCSACRRGSCAAAGSGPRPGPRSCPSPATAPADPSPAASAGPRASCRRTSAARRACGRRPFVGLRAAASSGEAMTVFDHFCGVGLKKTVFDRFFWRRAVFDDFCGAD